MSPAPKKVWQKIFQGFTQGDTILVFDGEISFKGKIVTLAPDTAIIRELGTGEIYIVGIKHLKAIQ